MNPMRLEDTRLNECSRAWTALQPAAIVADSLTPDFSSRLFIPELLSRGFDQSAQYSDRLRSVPLFWGMTSSMVQ